MGLGNQIRALGQNFTVFDDDGGERPAALGYILAGDVDGALCEVYEASSISDSIKRVWWEGICRPG